MNWYIEVLKKYAVFSGRACRSEYWFFILFNFIIGSILGLLSLIPVPFIGSILSVFAFAYSLGIIIPSIAVTVRRLHDINRSALSLFFLLIPFAGSIIFIVFLATDGTPDQNQYGINIKPVETEKKTNKWWVISILIISAVIILAMSFNFSFKSISSSEMFTIYNLSNDNYYLNVSTDKGISEFSLKRYEYINDVRYNYICKTGKYKLNGTKMIFQGKKNDDDIDIKLKSIFDIFEIVDENDNVIWDLNNDNVEKISKIEGFLNTVFWSLRIE